MRMHRRTLLKSMAAALVMQPLAGASFSLKAAGLAAHASAPPIPHGLVRPPGRS